MPLKSVSSVSSTEKVEPSTASIRGFLVSRVGRENLEARPTLGLPADWQVGENQRCACCYQRANVPEKGWINRDTVFDIFKVWRFLADADGGNPIAPAVSIDRRISRVNVRAG